MGIAQDAAGDHWVTDSGNNRIEIFSPSNAFIGQVTSLNAPSGVAIDAQGYVYEVDSGSYTIQKFNALGGRVAQWGGVHGSAPGAFENPSGIAVDSAGTVYVTDGDGRVERFTSQGGFLGQWTVGANVGGVAVDASSNVYVAIGGGVTKFTSSGTPLTHYGNWGWGPGQFDDPYGVAVDPAGDVYVTNLGPQLGPYPPDPRVEKFRSDGTFLTQWGSEGNGNGQFAIPSGIILDSTTGRVYVTDYYGRIDIFIW